MRCVLGSKVVWAAAMAVGALPGSGFTVVQAEEVTVQNDSLVSGDRGKIQAG